VSPSGVTRSLKGAIAHKIKGNLNESMDSSWRGSPNALSMALKDSGSLQVYLWLSQLHRSPLIGGVAHGISLLFPVRKEIECASMCVCMTRVVKA
jgi:hypothetical protein